MVKCIICGTIKSIHEHHIVPRAYGGENGPTVNICAIHHNIVHSAAICGEKSRRQLISGHAEEQKRRLLDLILIIRRARVATRYIARPLRMQIEFPVPLASDVRRLKKILGCSSLQQVVLRSISIVAHDKLQ